MLLSANTLRKIKPLSPFVERSVIRGRSYGLSLAGYDVRCAQNISLHYGKFSLASTVERFRMPNSVLGIVKNKSSWARLGLNVYETVIEPGWEGYLTIEMVNNSRTIEIYEGDPIAQVLFFQVDDRTPGYSGKYQHQKNAPQEAVLEL